MYCKKKSQQKEHTDTINQRATEKSLLSHLLDSLIAYYPY